MSFPFEVSFDEVQSDLDAHVDVVFGCLESEFLVLPKGRGFVEFSTFEAGYEALKRTTSNFAVVTPERVMQVVSEVPISLIVLRCILGFTPPEWAYYASRLTGVAIGQGAARSIDRKIRMDPEATLPRDGSVTEQRINALVATACHILASGAPETPHDNLHRLDKVDTRAGPVSLQALANLGCRIPCCYMSAFSVGRSRVIGIRSAN